MDPILGTIIMFAGSFAPVGWAFCNGQTLSISQNQALYSLIGTLYGGDGTTTFQLPNLQGRAPIHSGQLGGGGNYVLGQIGGAENVTLTVQQMPTHSHQVNADAEAGNAASPAGAVFAQTSVARSSTAYNTYTTGTPASPVAMAINTIANQGGNTPHTNMQPYLAVSFIIALQGVYPSRS